jgi:hypothetical protein
MYLNKTEEKARSFENFVIIMGGGFVLGGIIFPFVANILLRLTIGQTFGFGNLASVGIIIIAILIYNSIDTFIERVKPNEVSLSTDPFSEKTIDVGSEKRTDFIERTSGLHIKKPWEEKDDTVELGKDKSLEFDFTLSVEGDELRAMGIVTLLKDYTRLSYFVIHGDKEESRWNLIEKELKSYFISELEARLRSEKLDDIFADQSKLFKKTVTKITKSAKTKKRLRELGVVIDSVSAYCDYSEDTAETRKVDNKAESVKKIAEKIQASGVDAKDAWSKAMILGEHMGGVHISVGAPDNYRGNIHVGTIHAAPSSKGGKKSKDKDNKENK